MPNYIRVKQINPNELSGFFVDSISSESGLLLDLAEQAALNIFSSGTVLLTGNQTISGVKTFATGIIAPNLIYNTGNQTISGNKTFANNLNVSGDLTVAGTLRYNEIIDTTVTGNISGYTGIFQQVYANNLVYNTGNQTISGIKTFATGIIAPNLVYNTGNQSISGQKSFPDEVILYGGARFSNAGAIFYNVTAGDVDIDLLNRPYSNTRLSIGQDTGILGESINSINNLREIKIWETGGYFTQFSLGPFIRIGSTGTIISEQEGTKLGVGTKFPIEKVHISGGNLKVEGTTIATNLVYNTGNQNISGNKTFLQNVAITGNLDTNTGTFQSVRINKNRFLSYDYETGNFNIIDYVTIVNCALTGSGDFATGVLPSGNISGFNYIIKNINACPVVITGSGNYTIDNTPNLYIYSGESVELLGVTATNLTGWYTMNTNLGAV